MTEPTEHPFRQQVQDQLHQGEQALSPEVILRLQQARHQALEAIPKSRLRQPWVWAGSIASLLLVVVLSLQLSSPGLHDSMLEDMVMLAADEELELYQELEFYDWLATSKQHG